MRREERHHLKENPLAVWITELRQAVVGRGGAVTTALIVVGVGLVAAAGYLGWQERRAELAGDLLGQAMAVVEAQVVPPPATVVDEVDEPPADDGPAAEEETEADPDDTDPVPLSTTFEQPPGTYPSLDAKLEAALPRLLEAADRYPRTAAGITARYHAATVLVTLGRSEEAISQYEQVIELAEGEIYGSMAVLGLADVLTAAGRPEEAIALLEGETAAPESVVPVDAVLMQLGRAYHRAGQADQALASFTRVVEEFPLSAYYTDAQQQVDALRQETGDDTPSD